ncbi:MULTISPECIES: hypothetical protein [unclassified Pseudomonas]|uniref:hypothetical protein n=1 Tax=unclassified Pseudomonas TaxID=196821 RepID=UPI001F475AAF|nr:MULTISPECIES: hypothetical protein [unclassified Pseudomonas]MCF5232424.1 hypothetical protein [Pseudomonas sp. PA-5-4H]MCF5236851.1 hypothetical protein [Pseudomonas sp. PA-5-4G]MCF5248701.1 hypothetical protein [Pseudomonas sp. PA-5-4B]MCF5256777.1 hypothetical protein [Pseudomonas sp. PA-5-4B]MCF5263304.1 hypothetical protein [Pseudomonas sp. PA-5-4A]
MRILIAAAAVAMLAGCLSPGDLESKAPSIAVSSTKDPKKYAFCVFPKCQDARIDVTMSETEYGYRLVAASNNMTDELLSIRKVSSGSSVKLFQRLAWGPGWGRSDIEKAVRDCL